MCSAHPCAQLRGAMRCSGGGAGVYMPPPPGACHAHTHAGAHACLQRPGLCQTVALPGHTGGAAPKSLWARQAVCGAGCRYRCTGTKRGTDRVCESQIPCENGPENGPDN